MSDDAYAVMPRPGGLKLKGKGTKAGKKKKSKLAKKAAAAAKAEESEFKVPMNISVTQDDRTPAQKHHDENRLAREMDRIKKKAVLSHKEKVEALNKHLSTLSEHYDVPKVSWTK